VKGGAENTVYYCFSKIIKMSTPARRRLMNDFKKLQEDPPASGVSAAPIKKAIFSK